MITAGFTTIDPFTQTRTTVIESDAETDGRGWVLEVHCVPNAGPHILEHVHQSWTETFAILSGSALYKLDGRKQTADAGERIVMPPGVPHIHPWSAGDAEMVYRQINDFGEQNREAVQDVLGVFATINGLALEGRIGKRGLPKNPLQLAATLRTLTKHGGFDAKVPIPLQQLVAATLGRFAEALGYKSSYPRFVDG